MGSKLLKKRGYVELLCAQKKYHRVGERPLPGRRKALRLRPGNSKYLGKRSKDGSTPMWDSLRNLSGSFCGTVPPCDNTLIPPHPVGGRASKTVSPGSPVGEYPPRKKPPKSTHARRRPGEGASSDKHELCDRKFTCPRRRSRVATHASPFYPVPSPRTLGKFSSDTLKGPSKNPSQIPSKDARKTVLRHPQRTLGKPSPQGPRGP